MDHPTQALADIMTLEENVDKPLNQCKLVFCGDTRNNVAYCLMYICSKLGIHYCGYGPKELYPAPEVLARCAEAAKESGAEFILLAHNQNDFLESLFCVICIFNFKFRIIAVR